MESGSDTDEADLHVGSGDEANGDNSDNNNTTGDEDEDESSSEDERRQTYEDEETSDSDHCPAVDQHQHHDQTSLTPCSGSKDILTSEELQPSTTRRPTASEDDPGSREKHEITGSELQLYSLPLPGTSCGISLVGGTVATGTRHGTTHISDEQANDFLQASTSSGLNTTVDTRDNREVHLHLTQNIIKDSAVNMGGKTFINPARKQKKQTRKPSTSTPGQKLRLSTESRIEEWTQGMVHTAATQSVLDLILQGKTWITVTGSPGEGKTTAAYLTLKKLYSMGRQVFEIRTPDDYFKVKDSKSPVLLFNDIYGSNQFSIDSLGKWEPVLADILDMKEHRQLKSLSSGQRDSKLSSQKRSLCVILVSRSIVLHSATCHLGRFKNLIQESVVNLTTDIKVSAQERLDMWKYHADMYNVSIDEKTVIDVCRMPLSHGFPHCCRLFASMYSENKSLSMNSFFSKPIEFLHQTIESLLADSTTGKLLREMLRHDGCLELDSITDDERRYNFKKVSEKLEGTYLSKEKGSVTFHHPSVYASVAFVVCKTDSLFVIRFCSLSFLNERVRFLGLESGEKDTLVTLFIDSKYIDDYIQRLNNELILGIITCFLP